MGLIGQRRSLVGVCHRNPSKGRGSQHCHRLGVQLRSLPDCERRQGGRAPILARSTSRCLYFYGGVGSAQGWAGLGRPLDLLPRDVPPPPTFSPWPSGRGLSHFKKTDGPSKEVLMMNHPTCHRGHPLRVPSDRRSNGHCAVCSRDNEHRYRCTLRTARQRLAELEA
jgi:hypothetical protein